MQMPQEPDGNTGHQLGWKKFRHLASKKTAGAGSAKKSTAEGKLKENPATVKPALKAEGGTATGAARLKAGHVSTKQDFEPFRLRHLRGMF